MWTSEPPGVDDLRSRRPGRRAQMGRWSRSARRPDGGTPARRPRGADDASGPERAFEIRIVVLRFGPCPTSDLVAPFEPTGDQPQAIDKLVDGLSRGLRHQTLLGVTGSGKTYTMAQTIAASPEADARPGPQQDARRPAVLRVPRVLPGQRGRVLRQLLRLLPARGVPAAVGHVHREGLEPERGDRPAAPRRHPRAVRAARRDHRRVGVVHLRPRRAGRLRRHGPQAAGRRPLPARRGAPPPRRPPVPAQRRRRSPARGSASAATRSRSGRPARRSSSGSSSSATRSSGSRSSTR